MANRPAQKFGIQVFNRPMQGFRIRIANHPAQEVRIRVARQKGSGVKKIPARVSHPEFPTRSAGLTDTARRNYVAYPSQKRGRTVGDIRLPFTQDRIPNRAAVGCTHPPQGFPIRRHIRAERASAAPYKERAGAPLPLPASGQPPPPIRPTARSRGPFSFLF